MNIEYWLTSSFFFVWILRNTFFWVALWQLKEYRFDRMMVHFKETKQGRQLFTSSFLLMKLFLMFLYPVIIFDSVFLPVYRVIILLLFASEILVVGQEVLRHAVRRPVITFKSAFIIVIADGFIYLLYLLPLVDKFFWLLLLDKLLPFFIALLVFFLSLPTEFFRDLKVQQAMKKLSLHKNLLVIGITGSYGKSSTKEYVAQILSKKFSVLKTKGTNNTPIGIANTILTGLKKNTEIFVAEMGAYKIGEIAQMCAIVHPKIGILTAVNMQHSSLFGSLENTKKGKYELIEALPKDGFGLFNGNNENVQLLYNKTKTKKVLYKTINNETPKKEMKGDIVAQNIHVEKTSVSFDVLLHGKELHIKAPVLGAHNVENILPGIFVADYLGMSEKEIKQAIATLTPLTKTMVRHELPQGVTLIDDTFNSNPEAVIAAVSYIKVYGKKRILVLQPMIELGGKAEEQHYKVAQEISPVCDYLFVTNSNFNKALEKGLTDGGGKCQLKVGNAVEIAAFISANTSKGDVIVFEGKEAAMVLDKIV